MNNPSDKGSLAAQAETLHAIRQDANISIDQWEALWAATAPAVREEYLRLTKGGRYRVEVRYIDQLAPNDDKIQMVAFGVTIEEALAEARRMQDKAAKGGGR